MERTEFFNPARLSIARDRRGMTKVGLAVEVGVAPRTITQYERGAQTPRENTLQRIASVLRFPASFFTRDDPDGPSVEALSFRALSRMSARARNQALGFAAVAMDFADWIDENFATPTPNVPQFFGVPPSLAAPALRREWGLGEAPLPHLLDLVETHGVRVFSLPRELDSVDASSFWRNARPYIFLNCSKSAERGRFDIAHELGHLVMHDADTAHGKQAEADANQFAAAFLMPEAEVAAYVPPNPTIGMLIDLKKRWGVSLAALTHRCHQLGIMSKWRYRDMFIDISRRGFRTREPEGLPIERSQILDSILDVSATSNVRPHDIARELSINVADLNAMIFGLELVVDNPIEALPFRRGASSNLQVIC